MIDTHLRHYVQKGFEAMAKPLIAINLSPTQITLMAFAAGLISCVFVCLRTFPFRMAAIACGAVSALLDILDGTVARATNRSSPLGSFLDLILDRIVEAVFILAFVYIYPAAQWPGMVFLILVIINFSCFLLAGTLFPNTGKKSIHYESGLVERTETFILFGLMLIFPETAPWLLWIFNILMAGTAIYRFARIVSYARTEGLDGRRPQ